MSSSRGLSFFVLVCSLLCFAVSAAAYLPPFGRVGYYAFTCPSAEYIVRQAVYQAASSNPGLAAGLIRMHFHDCFVRGCDASVLLDTVPGGPPAEKDSPPNKGSLRGFEVIDAAKAQLEAECPGVVSCADIIAFAARDSASKVGNIYYEVPAGRRDGRVSLASEALQNLPAPFSNFSTLVASFAKKGISIDEMVTLSGAHSIGIAHCTSFANRLFPNPDPSMDPTFAAYLTRICPPPASNSSTNPTVAQDILTPNLLDNSYYRDLHSHRVLFTSDQALLSNPATAKLVSFNANYGSIWAQKFAAAMVHMGTLNVLNFPNGEIRKNCHFVNKQT